MCPGLALAVGNLDLQFGFAWKPPSPVQVAAISDCFIAQAWSPQAKHRWGLTLAYSTQKTPGPAHPVDSYRSCWSTTTLLITAQLILHGRQRLVVSGHSQSLQLTGLGKSLILMPTTTKAQLQEGVLSPHEGCTSSAQFR